MKLSMESLGFDEKLIIDDLSSYYKAEYTKKQLNSILKNFESIEDYINIFYYLKFIEKLTVKSMEKILNFNNPQDIYYRLYNLGWIYEGDLQTNIERHNKKKKELDLIKEESKSKDLNLLVDGRESLYQKAMKLKSSSYRPYGFNNPIEYANAMYFYINEKQLTSIEVALLIGCGANVIYTKLKVLGLNTSHSEAIKLKKDRNRQDYSKTFRNIKKSQTERFFQEGLRGSDNENGVRTLLENIIGDYVNIDEFEVIVGLNTLNIIKGVEIDIPIVIISSSNKIFKFAIEYNGEIFHREKERDLEKKIKLEEKGWQYRFILECGDSQEQKFYGDIKSQVESICNEISKIVHNVI